MKDSVAVSACRNCAFCGDYISIIHNADLEKSTDSHKHIHFRILAEGQVLRLRHVIKNVSTKSIPI